MYLKYNKLKLKSTLLLALGKVSKCWSFLEANTSYGNAVRKADKFSANIILIF